MSHFHQGPPYSRLSFFFLHQIGRLKKLVGRKGFSNNPAAEISDVMKLFEGDMAGLQKDISSLQRWVWCAHHAPTPGE